MRTVDPATWSKNKVKLGVKPTWQRVQGLEARLRKSLADAFAEYLTHCTLKGIRHTRDERISNHMRRCYGLLIVFLIMSGTSVIMYSAYKHSTRPPLQVNVRTSADSPSLSFPAVAICSNCIVSEKALQKYAEELAAKDNNSTYTTKDIKEYIKNFGAMINLSRPEYKNLAFLRFLYKIDSAFNITDLMYKLAPKCSSILKKCAWRGHSIGCEILFTERATALGYCCVFNSRYHPVDINNKPKTLEVPGQNFGLTVAVREDREDFAVIRRPITGFQVLLFEGSEYPLIESGAVRVYPVGVNGTAFFQLTAHAQHVSKRLEGYSDKWRGCRIPQVGPRTALSSYSWCLTFCRRFTTLAVCNCLPFYLLPNETDTVCTTEHLQCLYKHKEKLVYYYPGETQDSSLDEELQDSQMCTECIPDCARLLHTAAVFHTVYYYPTKLLKSQFSSGVSLMNTTILRFFYPTISHQVYNVEINMSWYEAFASISCQIWFLLGASLVCVAELVFHLTFRWAHHFWRRTQQMKRITKRY
ncbi:hypothetical protein ABMA28_007985 [Loxostege sticticalis]|uniref:Sodium channel protein Nach n=1 Tax=Loxostege sticticalis TaxID=481309 RepID=A0ABD0SJH7_LOXSC